MRNKTDRADDIPLMVGISVGSVLILFLLALAIEYSYRVAFRRRDLAPA
jgi:hypothetical protein